MMTRLILKRSSCIFLIIILDMILLGEIDSYIDLAGELFCDANEIQRLKRKDVMLLSKNELARRMGCNRRTIDKFIKQAAKF